MDIMTLEYLVSESYCYCWTIAIMVAFCCVLINRLAGRTEQSCPTWQDKMKMAIIYFMCIFTNVFLIWLLMMAQEAWFIQHFNINI